MPLADLLQRLHRQGIVLRVEHGALGFRAPKGAFTPELRALVQARAPEIIAFLQDGAEASGIPAVDRAQPVRMSFGQERIWFLYRLEGPSSTYNITPVFRLRGPLSLPTLRESFTALTRRHETLRMRFSEIDGLGVQVVDPPSDVPVRVVSLLDLPAERRMEAAERIVLEETARPFDLERSPSLRVTLVELSGDDHILLPFLHHIVADGWSLGVLQRELNQLYEASVSGRPLEWPPLSIQYPDFAVWQRATQQGERGSAGLDWWRRQLAGAPQTLALPLDFERPAALTFNGRVLHRTIPEQTASAIAAVGRAEGCSLFMVLFAAYAVLLHRHSRQEDILVGSPVAGRPTRELEALIGCFVNTVVLRVRLEGASTFVDLLRQVRQTALDTYAWQDVPVEAVIDAVIAQRDPSRIPLFQTQFSLQNVPVRAGAVSRLQVEPLQMDRVAAKNDLSFILESRAGDGIAAEVEFNTDLFREATVQGLWEDYRRLLDSIVATPNAPIAGLEMRPPEAQPVDAIVDDVARDEAFPDLVTWFEASAARWPHVPAVRDEHETLTYEQLDRRAEAIAARLLPHDLPADSAVGVLTGRTVNLVAAILGVLKAGAAYVPLSADHPPERLRFMLAHSGARVLIADEANASLAHGLAFESGISALVLDARAPAAAAPTAARARRAIASTDLAYIIFTSGSTGRPKGAMIQHRSVVNLVHALRELVYHDLGERLNVALVASPVFDASVQQIFATLLHGHTLCLVPDDFRRDGERLCTWLREQRIDVCDGTPMLLGLMLHGGLAARAGVTVRHLLIGGEPLSADLIADLHATAAGRRIVVTNVYGPTECCVDVVALRIDEAYMPGPAVIPIGRPMRNCRAFVVDDTGAAVAPGVPGELIIAGRCVGRGYVNDAALTEERFRAFPALGVARGYRTGDLCRQTRDGIIEFLGRNDDQVKILGYRIELGEVEHHLRAHPSLEHVTVQARTTSKGYRELVAYLVSSAPLNVGELRAFAASRMPAYMIPAYFVPLDALPLNESGKISRRDLPDPETAVQLPSGTEYRAAATAAEEALLAVWKATLKLERVGVGDNYFASGGDSIKALQLAARLRESGWIVEIRDIFTYPTIDQLAPHLRARDGAAVRGDDGPDTGRAPLSAIQRFFFETYGATAAFNQALLLRVLRPLTLDRLRAACAALTAHHGMLRARFVHEAAGWTQEVLSADAVQPIVERLDLTASSNAGEDLRAHTARMQERFSLEAAPLWSAVLYDVPDGQRLLLTAHHLVVDGVSWRILLDDLERVLEQLTAGADPALPHRSASYRAWVEYQQRAVRTTLAQEVAYWTAASVGRAEPRTDEPDRQSERRERRATLTEELTRALLTGAHKAYATEINDLLIAAVARAWCAWTGERRCALTIEGHGREPLGSAFDVSRTVGWFTSIYPVTVELPPDIDTGGAIKLVKETLRAIPNKGAGYAALRYLSGDGHRLAPLPPLAFNYLGRFDSAGEAWFEAAPEPAPPTAASDVPLPWPLDITAAVVGGRMEIALAYSAPRVDAAAAQTFLTHIQSELEGIVHHTINRGETELTASDFDYAGLTQQGLDDFLNTL